MLLGISLLLFWCPYSLGSQDIVETITPEIYTPLKTEVTFGITFENSAQESEKRWKETFDYLQTRLKQHRVQMKIFSWNAMIAEMEQGNLDFVLTNPAIFIYFKHKFSARPLLSLLYREQSSYFSKTGAAIIRLTEAGNLQTLQDLEGARFGAVNQRSWSGWFLAKNLFHNAGLETKNLFSSQIFLNSHEDVVNALLEKTIDAGIVGSGILEKLQNRGKLQPGQVTVIHKNDKPKNYPYQLSTKLYPGWVLSTASHTREKLVYEVIKGLLAIEASNRAAIEGNYYGWSAPQDYDSVRKVMQSIRIPPFEDYGIITWQELLKQYFTTITLISLSLLALATLAIYQKKLNTRIHKFSNSYRNELIQRRVSQKKLMKAKKNIKLRNKKLQGTLTELKLSQKKIIAQEKLASLGQLAAGIAHEIKNPLNIIINFSQLLQELIEDLKEYFQKTKNSACTKKDMAIFDEICLDINHNSQKIIEQGKRADSIVRNMLSHSRGGSHIFEEVDVNALVKEAVQLAYHAMRSQENKYDLTIDYELNKQLPHIPLVAQNISQVFINVASNAIYAMGEKNNQIDSDYLPLLVVTTAHQQDKIIVTIKDNGIGMDETCIEKVFNPFFTTKPPADGTGLGMSISYDIVCNIHKGELLVDSKVGEYAEFRIFLPTQHL